MQLVMASAKKRRTTARAPKPTAESQFTLVLEDLRGQFKAFGEALRGLSEQVDRRFEAADKRFDSIERQLGLLTDAVRTHSKALQSIETRLDEHEARIDKLEGAAE
jgi:chromosome segregation ATPase